MAYVNTPCLYKRNTKTRSFAFHTMNTDGRSVVMFYLLQPNDAFISPKVCSPEYLHY